jgi:hypothetical protein
MKLLTQFPTFLLILLAGSFELLANIEYESKKYPAYSIGDVLTYTEIEKGQDYLTESTITEKLVEKETIANSVVERWEVIDTQTSPTLEVTRTLVWKDTNGDMILEDYLDNDGEGFTAVYNTINGIGEKTLSIGNQVTDKSTVGSVTLKAYGYLYGGYGAEKVSEILSGVIALPAPIGSVNCFKLSYSQEAAADLYNDTQGKFSMGATASGTVWHSNKYGLVKSEITTSYNYLLQGESSSASDVTTKTLISANISNSTANSISLITNNSQSVFDGWSWHSWPWVYNSERGWLFYYGNNVWENSSRRWFFWDSSSSTWLQ